MNRCLILSEDKQGKIIVLVAPSGSGKTTIAKKILRIFPEVRFSISATTRRPRADENDGVDYFFLGDEAFTEKVKNGDFLEWEEFYNGTRYGTLRSEVDKMTENGYFPLLDIEVKGAMNIKKMYGQRCVTIFIRPPSLKELKRRLIERGSETKQSLQNRIERAEKELLYAEKCDYVVVNDQLEHACGQVETILNTFIK